MKRYAFVMLLGALAACQSPTSNTSSADTAKPDSIAKQEAIPGPECFLHLDGTSNQDSTWLRIEVAGSDVRGELNWIPAGKDARRGTISGSLTGDEIKGTWTYMQEGMQQKLPVAFKLAGDKVYQQAYSFDQSTGAETLAPNAPFDREFHAVNCP